MRALLSVAALLVAGPVLAQSIDKVKSLPVGTADDSITHVTCPTCPKLQPKKTGYSVPALGVGKQTVELRTVSGKQKIFRTEAWLGGSPVVFVSTPTPEMIAALTQTPVKGHDPIGDGIDSTSKTAALPAAPAALEPKAPVAASMDAAPVEKVAEKAPQKAQVPLDTTGFSLRTN